MAYTIRVKFTRLIRTLVDCTYHEIGEWTRHRKYANQTSNMQTSPDAQLRQMRQDLETPPDQMDVTDLLPIFVPSVFFASGKWPGPYVRLRAPGIGLTWTLLRPSQTMRYVDFKMKRYWEERQLKWQDLALRNLAKRTNDCPGARELRRETGELLSIAFMFEDGLGPSRLLFREGLAQRFPAGYRVAMPEMSCGLAFAKDLHGKDLTMIDGVIDNCYRHGTRPFVPGSFDPEDLLPLEEGG